MASPWKRRLAALCALGVLVAPSVLLAAPAAATPAPSGERLVVGFTTLPRELVEGGELWDAEVLRVDVDLQFAVVRASSRATFEARALQDERVRYVEADPRLPLLLFVPNDPRYGEQYGPGQVGAPAVWDVWRGSTAKTVCIVDTGVRPDHEDLTGTRYLGGWDYVNNDADPRDDQGHGTHVAGIAAATTNNGKGIAGIAQANIRAVKVLDSGGFGSFSDVASGINHCSSNAVGVVSLSLGAPSGTTALRDAVDLAWSRGSLVVAASGNDGCTPCVYYPAAYANAIAVGCTTSTRARCSFSNGGPELDLVAPGNGILSTYVSSATSYVSASGTSMSAPHVSGVAALLWSYQPDLTNVQLRALLESHAVDLGSAGRDDLYGRGLVDALAAYQAIEPNLPLTEVYNETFDVSGAPGFTLTGMWHVTSACSTAVTPPNHLGYHSDSTCTYDTLGSRNSGTATRSFDLAGLVQADIAWDHRYEHESASIAVDSKKFQVSRDGGASWDTLVEIDARTASSLAWRHARVSLDSYVGGPILARWSFDTGDALNNGFDGWMIDNVALLGADNWPPVARAGADVTLRDGDGDGAATVGLDGGASSDRDGAIASAVWRRDGATIATGLVATVALPVGAHALELTVTDDDGASATDTLLVTVLPNSAPVALFSHACPGERRCTFNATASTDLEGPIASYAWDWGDGTTGAGALAEHTYEDEQVRNVTLTVTDAAGAAHSVTRAVRPLGSVILFEDFDDGLADDLTLSGLWHVSGSCVSSVSAPNHLAYRRTTACDYATGVTHSGTAAFTLFLPPSPQIELAFQHMIVTETCSSRVRDTRTITIQPAGGATTTLFHQDCRAGNTPSWTPMAFNLTAFGGTTSTIRFLFSTGDSLLNGFPGWAIEDVRVTTGPRPPLANAGPDLTVSDGDGTLAETVVLDGRASTDDRPQGLSYAWTLGDAPIGDASVITHSFPVGTHVVALTVTDEDGQSSADTAIVNVLSNLVPIARAGGDLSARDVDGDGAQSVTLDGSASSDADGTIVEHLWSVGPTTIGTGARLVASFPVGSTAVTLRVTDNGGATSNASIVVRVEPNRAPLAIASSDVVDRDIDGDGVESVPLASSGSNDPDGTPLSYAWLEGDVVLSTAPNPTLLLPVGEHLVVLRVTDIAGAWDEDEVNVTVHANRAPVAVASPDVVVTDRDGTGAETVSLSSAGTADPDGTPLAYEWRDHGELVSTLANPTLALAVGEHVLTLRATDIGGAWGEDVVNVTVLPNTPPVAQAAVSCVEHVCVLDARASFDPDGLPVLLAWSLGDGATSTQSLVEHEYPEEGAYAWELRVRDAGGAEDLLSGVVQVAPAQPRAAPMAAPPAPGVPDVRDDPGAESLPGADVRAAWFEADHTYLYVGLEARPGPSAEPLVHEVSFDAGWTPTDPTWGGRVTPADPVARVRARAEPAGAERAFVLQGVLRSGATVALGAVDGTWDDERGLGWWVIPRASLALPLHGALLRAPEAVSLASLPRVEVELDATGAGAAWPVERTLEALEVVDSYHFDLGDDGFVEVRDAPANEVAWDPTRGSLLVVQERADTSVEQARRALREPLAQTRSFRAEATFVVDEDVADQPMIPLFLADAAVTRPQSDRGVATLGYRGAGQFTFELRDDTNGVRFGGAASTPVPREPVRVAMEYDAPTRTMTWEVLTLEGAVLARVSQPLAPTLRLSFDFVGVSTQAGGGTGLVPLVAHVDDVAVRYR